MIEPMSFRAPAEICMELKDLVQEGNTLRANLSIKITKKENFVTNVSPRYSLNGLAVFQIKVIKSSQQVTPSIFGAPHPYYMQYAVMIRFAKINGDDNLTYIITFSSDGLGIKNKRFITDNDIWHLINENSLEEYIFDITVRIDIESQASSFATLHDDTELTDFELRADNGSVRMHRAVLAVSSPVLRRMLCGTWKETTEGHIDVPGISRTTLQHFKDYMYLHILPDTDLEQLLLLSSCYIMPDLEQRCVYKLVDSLTAQNARSFLEFAIHHKITRLEMAILDCVQRGRIKVSEMYDHFLQSQ